MNLKKKLKTHSTAGKPIEKHYLFTTALGYLLMIKLFKHEHFMSQPIKAFSIKLVADDMTRKEGRLLYLKTKSICSESI